jgi:FG-GAP-like repeat/RTX calcium-binding nonapeptide repeat (4 copies)
MSFVNWLRNLRSTLGLRRVRGQQRRQVSPRAATRRPFLEALEDRCLLSFVPAADFAVAANPLDMVVADFNGDGNADLATVNPTQLSVLAGNGNGAFGAAQTTAAGAGMRSIAAGAFNSDSLPDLAISTSVTTWNGTSYVTTGSVLVLLNSTASVGGPVTFQAARSFSTGTNLTPGALAVGDLNGDGKADVAVAQAGGSSVSVLQGDGTGNLGAARHIAVGSNPVSVAVGDLDFGGKHDLITANQGSNDLSVLMNAGNDAAGDVQFLPATSVGVTGSAASVAVGDFDNNGLMDLAASSAVYTTTTWGWWGYWGYYSYSYTQTDGYANVLLGHGNGTFDPAQSIWVNSTDLGDLATGDFNGDGKLDAIVADGITRVTVDPTVLLGAGDGTFKTVYHYNAGSGPDAVVVGNFNSDAFPDVAVSNYYSGDVSVLMNDTDWRTLIVSGLAPSTTAGEAQTFTVTARDNAGNVLPSYTGTVHFTSSDYQADLPADYQFTAADAGVHTFTVTLKTAGWQSVGVNDPAAQDLSAGQGISVTPAAVSKFVINSFPSSMTIGDYGYFSAAPVDAYGNWVSNYAGTVHFTSSDGQAVLPDDYTFLAGSGAGDFYAVLQTVGTQSITVTDLANPSLTGTQSDIRVMPRVSFSGPSGGLRNQTLTFTLGASSGLPASTVFTYAIDWNYDGVADQTVSGPSGITVDHSYAATGWYYPGVTATVTVGGVDYTSYTAYQSVNVFAVTATIQADPGDATKSALVVEGTAYDDNLVLSPGAGNSIALSVSGYSVGSFSAPGGSAFGHLLVYGYAGYDGIYVTGGVTVPAFLFGGDGNDSLDAGGSIANNVLAGGAGSDWLYGGSSRDLLIGGPGNDTLRGGGDDDILIGSSTDYDANLQALLAVMKEWGRTDADYSTRIKHLQGSLSGGQNGSYRLTATTVHNDNTIDRLYGEAGTDWFLVGGKGKNKQDNVYDKVGGEVVTTL